MAIKELKEPIWTRQQGESDEAWRLFLMYRDTPVNEKRRYQDISEISGTSLDMVEKYGGQNKWRDRVLAYDRNQDAIRVEQINRRKIEMAERHSNVATMMIHKAMQAINQYNPDELSAKDATNMIDTAMKWERLSRGEATDFTRTVVEAGAESDRQMKETLRREAKEYFDEVTREYPELSLEEKLLIIKSEFQIMPEELGFTEVDLGNVQTAEGVQ
jgi:hypothetical protein